MLFCLLFLLLQSVWADIEASAVIVTQEAAATAPPRLYVYNEGKSVQLLSETQPTEGTFSWQLADIPAGVLRLYYGKQNGFIDLVYTGEDAAIAVHIAADNKVPPKVKQGAATMQWQTFLEKQGQVLQKHIILQQFMQAYPDTEAKVYQEAVQAHRIESEAVQQLYRPDPKNNTWVNKLIQCQQVLRQGNGRIESINTTDTSLWHTPYCTDVIVSYTAKKVSQGNPQNRKQVNVLFMEACDEIVEAFAANEDIRKYALRVLVDNFQKQGNEEVLHHLDTKYLSSDTCLSDTEIEERDTRMSAYKVFVPGSPAPEITFKSEKTGKSFNLKDIGETYVLIAFWSSGCQHCLEEMPRLSADAAGFKDTGIIAISMDTDKEIHRAVASKLPNMFHYCDFKKSKSQPAIDYKISQTPTFFLLDGQRNIIGRYSNYDAVKEDMYANKIME